MLRVVDKFIGQLEKRLLRKKIFFKISTKAKKWLAKHGYNPALGARPLSRLIDTQIKHKLTDLILEEKLIDGQTALVDVSKSELVVKIKALELQ
jgi:ATP-dependent Clp protease ATP-binding subunit ClpA